MKAASNPTFDYQQKLMALLTALTFVGYSVYSFLAVALNLSEFDSRIITVPYRAVVLALSLFLFLSAYFRRELGPWTRTHTVSSIVWLMYTARLIFDTLYRNEPLSRPPWEFWAFALGVCFFSFIGLVRRFSDEAQRWAAWLVWGLAAAACLLGLLTQSGQVTMTEERVSGNQILNPISYGQTAVTLVLMACYLALHARKTATIVWLLASTLPGFYTIALAASRSPLISLALGMALLSIHGIKRGIGWKIALGFLAVAIALPIGVEYLLATGSTLTNRLFETYDAYRTGEVDRLVLWGITLEEFSRSPVWGAGIELSIGMHPHNLILEACLTMGFVGGGLFLWLMLDGIWSGIRLLSSAEAAWMPLVFMQFFTASLFSGNLWSSVELWAIVLLQAGAVAGHPANRFHGTTPLAAAPQRALRRGA
ncbi:O-antigen ligase family protein [Oleiharenicola sp. Vm1]|uniref:O-antigen ligase family protein n=1 Tax=Oleiharenicola sp. Vm1 TaxID=3398393 RepID=UPI0039F64394